MITVASGKGGVGKSCLTSNLGTLLARSGLRVMMVDGDFGLANLDILLGVQPGATLEQVLSGEARLQDSIVGVEPNLWLVPAASGLMELRQSDAATRRKLSDLFDECPWEMDVILLDIGAGIQSNVLSLHSPAFRSVIVLTPEPTSLTDAYGLIKTLRRNTAVAEFFVVVNQVSGEREARAIFQRLKDVADRFIDVRIEFLGHWEKDEKITQAVMKRKILLDWDREAGGIPSLKALAGNLRERFLGDGQRDSGIEAGRARYVCNEHESIDSSSVREGSRLYASDEPVIAASLKNVVERSSATGIGSTSRFWTTLLGSRA